MATVRWGFAFLMPHSPHSSLLSHLARLFLGGCRCLLGTCSTLLFWGPSSEMNDILKCHPTVFPRTPEQALSWYMPTGFPPGPSRIKRLWSPKRREMDRAAYNKELIRHCGQEVRALPFSHSGMLLQIPVLLPTLTSTICG